MISPPARSCVCSTELYLLLSQRKVQSNDTQPPPAESRNDAALIRANRGFYELLWADAKLLRPERCNTWPLVRELAAAAPRRLEVAPGLRQRLPLDGTCFVDLTSAMPRYAACMRAAPTRYTACSAHFPAPTPASI